MGVRHGVAGYPGVGPFGGNAARLIAILPFFRAPLPASQMVERTPPGSFDAGVNASCRDANAVTREHKLALIVGFSLFLVLGVLISDHFSKARQVELVDNIQPASAKQMGASPPGVHLPVEPGVTGAV